MKNTKLVTAYVLVLFVNLLFTAKYLTRFSEFGIYLGFIITGFQIGGIIYLNRKNIPKKIERYSFYAFIFFLTLFAFLNYLFVSPESLNVDRWSVISSFSSELLKGNYPYLAKSHMGNYPGPMPVYFVIALPFYLLGELNILSTIGYVFFILFLLKKDIPNSKNMLLLFLMASSLFIYWEIATRSNIFTYSVFTFLALQMFLSLNKDRYNFQFFLSAVLIGLLLSTRAIFVLAYIVIFLSTFYLKEIKFKSLTLFASISLITFAGTFLPFIVFFKENFLSMNPFIIQSSFLIPGSYIYIFLIMSIALSFFVKNDSDKFFYSGVSLFLSISLYFLYHVVNNGFDKTFFVSGADISYFLFCLPFMFYFILKAEKSDVIGSSGLRSKYKHSGE